MNEFRKDIIFKDFVVVDNVVVKDQMGYDKGEKKTNREISEYVDKLYSFHPLSRLLIVKDNVDITREIVGFE